MSETFRLGVVLALAGGFMDAYSYLCRGEVFANAQTGNMLLFGVCLVERNFAESLQYLMPVLAFTLGIILSELVRFKLEKSFLQIHWRQIAIFVEAVILLGVAFIPLSQNLLANSLTSLACGIQVESFRKIHGNAIATTMCIGNLRSGTQNLCDYIRKKDKTSLKKSLLYYGIIIFFIIGAVIGSMVIKEMQQKAILVCAVILFLVFLMMFRKKVGNES